MSVLLMRRLRPTRPPLGMRPVIQGQAAQERPPACRILPAVLPIRVLTGVQGLSLLMRLRARSMSNVPLMGNHVVRQAIFPFVYPVIYSIV